MGTQVRKNCKEIYDSVLIMTEIPEEFIDWIMGCALGRINGKRPRNREKVQFDYWRVFLILISWEMIWLKRIV